MSRRLAFTIVALLAMCIGVRAQESASSGIAGQVLDTSKAGVPGATVTVTNVAHERSARDPIGSRGTIHRSESSARDLFGPRSSCQDSRPRNSKI